MHLNRAIHHRQADAAALLLGREIQIEDALQVLGLDADAGVGERDRHAAAARRLAANAQRAAVRHRLTGVQRQVEKRLPQHRRIAVDVGRAVAVDARAATPARSASGRTIGTTSSSSAAERDRLQLEILGPRELQEPLHDLVEPADLVGDDVDVLERRRRSTGDGAAARRARPPRAARAAAAPPAARRAAANCCRSSSR